MKNKNNKKTIIISIIIIIIMMFLLVKLTPNQQLKADTVNYQTLNATSNNDIVNLASPDLQGKDYLGNGVYSIYDNNGVSVKYNVYSGFITFNGVAKTHTEINFFKMPNTLNPNIYDFSFFDYSNNELKDIRLYDRINRLTYISMKQNINKSGEVLSNNSLVFWVPGASSFTNYQFKFQIEKGETGTPYQTPIGALKQHSQFEHDRGYQQGFDNGNDTGYQQGFDDGLQSVLEVRDYLGYSNLENIRFLGRNAAGPNERYFGYEINNIDAYIEHVTFFSTMLQGSTVLSPLNEVSSGMQAGITLYGYDSKGNSNISFVDMANMDDEYSFYNNKKEYKVKSIVISFLLKPNLSGFNFAAFQQSLFENISLFINNQYFNDLFIKRISDIYYNDGYDAASNELQQIIDYQQSQMDIQFSLGFDDGYKNGYSVGYDKGLVSENNAVNSLLAIFFSSLTFFGGFEILPGFKLIYGVGIIVMISLIAWLSGRKGGD